MGLHLSTQIVATNCRLTRPFGRVNRLTDRAPQRWSVCAELRVKLRFELGSMQRFFIVAYEKRPVVNDGTDIDHARVVLTKADTVASVVSKLSATDKPWLAAASCGPDGSSCNVVCADRDGSVCTLLDVVDPIAAINEVVPTRVEGSDVFIDLHVSVKHSADQLGNGVSELCG